jgi:uncharacterized protein (TIGR02246 family)
MTNWRTRLVVPLFGAALIGGASIAAQSQQTKGPDAELKKLAETFSQAWAKADAKAIAALHTEDAIRLPGTGQVIAGRAAIEENYSQALSGPWKGSTISIIPGQTKQLAGDVYVGEGRFQITGGTPPAGIPTAGQYLNTYVRQGGRWALAASAVVYPPTTR